jgi:hypothetical protein
VVGEGGEDGGVAVCPALLEWRQLVLERARPRLQPEDNEMHPTEVLQRELGPGDELDPHSIGHGARFPDALLGVVVGEGDCAQARRRCLLDQDLRVVRSVGGRGMGV